MPDSPRLRRILGVAVVAAVVAALAAIVVLNGGDEDSVVAGSSDTTTTAAAKNGDEGTTETTAVPDGGGTSTSGPAATDAPEGTVQGSGEAPTPTSPPPRVTEERGGTGEPEDPGPTTPPKAGTYTYSWSREGGDSPQSGELDVVVTDAGSSAGERRQTIEYRGGEGTFANEVAWRADGGYVLETMIRGDQEYRCDWDPDFQFVPTTFSEGATWSYVTSCTVTFNGTPVQIERKGELTVVGLVRIDVAGTTVDTWQIDSVEETAFGAFGSSKEETTAYFSPQHGLRVKSTTQRTGGRPGEPPQSSTERAEIKSLTPQ